MRITQTHTDRDANSWTKRLDTKTRTKVESVVLADYPQ